jgi:hypothetical protein
VPPAESRVMSAGHSRSAIRRTDIERSVVAADVEGRQAGPGDDESGHLAVHDHRQETLTMGEGSTEPS